MAAAGRKYQGRWGQWQVIGQATSSSLPLPWLVQQLSHVPAGGSSFFLGPLGSYFCEQETGPAVHSESQLLVAQRPHAAHPITFTPAFVLPGLCTAISFPCLELPSFPVIPKAPPSLPQLFVSVLNPFPTTQPATVTSPSAAFDLGHPVSLVPPLGTVNRPHLQSGHYNQWLQTHGMLLNTTSSPVFRAWVLSWVLR